MNVSPRPTGPRWLAVRGLARLVPGVLVASLIACGGLARPGVGVAGTVEGWPALAGIVRAELPARGNRPAAVLAQGTIGPDGRFGLDLPDSAGVEPFLGRPGTTECASSLAVTPAGLRTAGVLFIASFSSGASAGLIEQRTTQLFTTGSRVVLRLYADRAGTVSGNCASPGLNQSPDLRLERGWNIVLFEKTAGDTASFRSVAAPPADARWFLYPATAPALRPGLEH